MNTATDVALVAALAMIWLSAGLLADALPDATTIRALHRRARRVQLLTGAGAAALVAVAVATATAVGPSAVPQALLLAAVPTSISATVTLRRLTSLRSGATAFAGAPLAPMPPALRAVAAHPLLATPLQVAGLATLTGVPIAAGLINVSGAAVAGVAITCAGLAVIAIAVRHALRHSRLVESGVPALGPVGRRTGIPF